MAGAGPEEVVAVVVHEVAVPLFFVTFGIGAGTVVVAVLGDDGTQADGGVEGPMLAPACLVAEVHVAVDVLALIAFAALPLPVVIACGNGEADVPALEPAVALAVAEVAAHLDAKVVELVGVGVVAPDEPGGEIFHLKAPLVLAPQGNLQLYVGGQDTPHQEVGFQGPSGIAETLQGERVGGQVLAAARQARIASDIIDICDVGWLDDVDGVAHGGVLADDEGGVAHHDGVANGNARLPADDGGGAAAERGEVLLKEHGPHLAALQATQLPLAVVSLVGADGCRQLDDAQHFVAPRLVAASHQVVEAIPAGSLVVNDNLAYAVSQALAHEAAHGLTSVLAQPLVHIGQTFGRSATIDVKAQEGGIDATEVAVEAVLERLPMGCVVGKPHIDADAIHPEEDAERIGLREAGTDGGGIVRSEHVQGACTQHQKQNTCHAPAYRLAVVLYGGTCVTFFGYNKVSIYITHYL